MGRIRILPDQVANQIAAGEVVDRPASVVKELLENALDAGANRIRVEVEAGGRKLIRIRDDGHGMNRDDALLAFERHATSKLRTADDLLSIATLGFRGEALPSIASVARVTLETCPPPETLDTASVGTRLEIAGGKILHVDDAAVPRGTTISRCRSVLQHPGAAQISARREHRTGPRHGACDPLRAGSSGEAFRTAVCHAHAGFSAAGDADRGANLPDLRKGHAGAASACRRRDGAGTRRIPEPPPWKQDPDEPKRDPGFLRLSGFYSKPELQKLNRNSIYIFVNKRLIRDRLLIHAITEAYRNIIPPTSYPVVLLFLEMPPEEVDVNVHPAKTEVRFRQQSLIHDFVRDSLRRALVESRPAAGFLAALHNSPAASPSLMPAAASPLPGSPEEMDSEETVRRRLRRRSTAVCAHAACPTPVAGKLPLEFAACRRRHLGSETLGRGGERAVRAGSLLPARTAVRIRSAMRRANGPARQPATAQVEAEQAATRLNHLGSLRPLGQLRDSFILAAGDDGLWIIDQHVAHERVLFEKILRDRQVENVQRQRLLMPILVELKPCADGGFRHDCRGAGAQRI